MSSKSIYKQIHENCYFLITTHIDPDLDALCSQLAMARYLESLGKKVYIINAQEVPSAYRFLKGSSKIKTSDKKAIKHEVVFVFDCGDLDRIGWVKESLNRYATVINIDHHITNTFFGKHNLVKPRASSTAEVLFDFFKESKIPLDRTTAELLYYGILTDTGSFRYDNTTDHTHRVAADLLKFHLPVYAMHQRVYARFGENDLKSFLKLASHFETFQKGKIVSFTLLKKDIQHFSNRFDLRETLFSLFRSMPLVQVVVIFTEVHSKLTKVNFRSTGQKNVAKFASCFSGGGHKAASGCRINDHFKIAKKKIFKVLERHVR